MPVQQLKGKTLELAVKIPVGSVELNGNLIVPENSTGIVLFAHGSGSSRLSPRNQFVAQVLRDAGLGTLLFDLLTEEEEMLEARTRHLRFDIPILAERLEIATNWLENEESVEGLGRGYFGSSTGAAAAMIAAAKLNNRIKAVVSRGGRPDLAGPKLPAVSAPTLLLVGERDVEVIKLNEEAFEQLSTEKSLEIIPGATHLFEELGTLEQVARRASEWFHKYLSQGNHESS